MKRNNMDAIKVDENNKEHGINVLEPIGYLYHKQTAIYASGYKEPSKKTKKKK